MRKQLSAIVALSGALMCAPSSAQLNGYAALVRRVAPSVVTVLVEEAPIGAGQRAAARAAAACPRANPGNAKSSKTSSANTFFIVSPPCTL